MYYYRTQRKIYKIFRTVYVVIDPANQKKHQHIFQRKCEQKRQLLEDFCQNQLNVKKWRDIDKVTTKLHDLIGKKPWKEIFTFTVSG